MQELTDKQKIVLPDAPPVVLSMFLWELHSEASPEMMQRVDVMLLSGMSQERILHRSPMDAVSKELRVKLESRLHWRKRQLLARVAANPQN